MCQLENTILNLLVLLSLARAQVLGGRWLPRTSAFSYKSQLKVMQQSNGVFGANLADSPICIYLHHGCVSIFASSSSPS